MLPISQMRPTNTVTPEPTDRPWNPLPKIVFVFWYGLFCYGMFSFSIQETSSETACVKNAISFILHGK
jgi:hypothetical protein